MKKKQYRFNRYRFVMRYIECERDKRGDLLKRNRVSREQIDDWAWEIANSP